MTEHHLLLLCLEKVARKASNRPVPEWTDSVFIGLSHELEKQTGVRISRNTLKRLFGKMKIQADYKPQKETRNALAMFAGYRDWEDFGVREEETLREQLAVQAEPQAPRRFVPTGKPGPPSQSLRWVAGIGLLALLLTVVSLWSRHNRPETVLQQPGRLQTTPAPARTRSPASLPVQARDSADPGREKAP